MFLGCIGITLGSIWGKFGVSLGYLFAYGGTLEPYLSQFDVEKQEMASVMVICANLVGPKSEHVEKVLVFQTCLDGSRSHEGAKENLQVSEPEHFLVTLGLVFVYEGDFG